MTGNQLHIQFLSLDSNVWPHNLAQTILIENLTRKGLYTTRLYCNGNLSGACIPLGELEQAKNLNYGEIDKLCNACRKRTSIVKNRSSNLHYLLDDFCDQSLFHEYQTNLTLIDNENWHKFTLDNLEIGRIAAYEFFLKYKLDNLLIPNDLFAEYLKYLKSTLKVVASARNALSELSPDAVISYNSLYSHNNAYSKIAEKMGINTYSIQGGSHVIERQETLSIYRSTKDLLATPFSNKWKEKSIGNPTYSDIDKSLSHFRGITQGFSPWAYSSEVSRSDARRVLSIDNDNPTILAVTSSEDEIFAAKLIDALPNSPYKNSFPSQKDFVTAIFSAAEKRKDWNFVVRVHPRLLPNKRDARISAASQALIEIFQNKPSNVYINTPSDNISIFDLYSSVVAGVNYRSSAGYEMMACGIPVVTCISQSYFPGPTEGLRIANDDTELVEKLVAAISDGHSAKNAAIAFNWWGYLFNHCSARILDNTPISISKFRPKKSKRLITIWRNFTKWIQLRLPTIRERIDLKRQKNSEVDPRFFEVLTQNLVGISECEYTGESAEDIGLTASCFAMNQIRGLIGLPLISVQQ